VSNDPDDWGWIPGRPEEWGRLEPVDPVRGRELVREFSSAAARWEACGQHDLAREDELVAAAMLAEVEAVEAGDEEAWLAAIADNGASG
jgi:hypothetical protein